MTKTIDLQIIVPKVDQKMKHIVHLHYIEENGAYFSGSIPPWGGNLDAADCRLADREGRCA
jgi:hypothetical protein